MKSPNNEDVLLIERRGPVVVITLHRPDVRNALNSELRTSLHQALADKWVPPVVCSFIERRLSPNPLVEIHKYPGADHAFARHDGTTYSAPEAEKALALSIEFFGRHLNN